MNFSVVDFEDFDFPLPEERDRFLPMHDPQRFVRRVEQESHFHAATSFPHRGSLMTGIPLVGHLCIFLCHRLPLKSSNVPSGAGRPS